MSREKLVAFVDQGLSLSEIGDELGIGSEAARSRLNRANLRAKTLRDKTIRQRAEGMKPSEAVEYLLGIIESFTDIAGKARHPVDDLPIRLTRAERNIMIALHDAGGRCVTKQGLLSAMCLGRIGDEPEIKIVDVRVCRLRKVLPPTVKIITHWGLGYSLQVAT